MNHPFRCLVCDAAALDTVPSYAWLPRVTSDCKPWPPGGQLAFCGACGAIQKLPDDEWRKEISAIYADYDSYNLSDAADQLIFSDTGAARPRSAALADFVVGNTTLPPAGRLLDIGCGKGAALANFAALLHGWELYGNEISARTLPSLMKIPGFVKLYTSGITAIDNRFTLVTLIHTLEHLMAPLRGLREIVPRVNSGGVLFIDVPDIEASPFDLLVADHLLHFSTATLAALVHRAGFTIFALSNSVLPKELSLLARVGLAERTTADAGSARKVLGATLDWLSSVAAALHSLAEREPIGLFGTAVASMAFYGSVRDRVRFFVDEDKTRQGKYFDGKPVLAPSDAPRDVSVFLVLAPAAAAKVAARLRRDIRLQVVEPPGFRGH